MAQKSTKHNDDLALEDRSKLRKNIFSMIIPISLEGLLQMVASTIIMAMIGRIDVVAINAYGITTRIVQLVWAVIRGLGVGVTVCVASDTGARRLDRIKMTSICGMFSLVFLGIIASIILAIFAPVILPFFGGDPNMASLSVSAIRLSVIGLPFYCVMLITASILQGQGNAKIPMFVTWIYNILAAFLGYVLIFGRLGAPAMGLQGAMLAILISQVAMCFLSLFTLYYYGPFRGGKLIKELKEYKAQIPYTIKRIFRLGTPTAIENLLWQLGSIAMMRPIMSFGDYAYAAHQLGLQAEAISYMPTQGFGIATTALISRSLGAENMDLAKAYFSKIKKYITIVTLCQGIILVVFRYPLMGLLTDDAALIELGTYYLIWAAVALFGQNFNGVLSGALRGVGQTQMPMVVSVIGLWCVRVPFSYLAAYVLPGSTVIYVWIGMTIDHWVRVSLSSYYLRKKKLLR